MSVSDGIPNGVSSFSYKGDHVPWFCLRTTPRGESLAIFFIKQLGFLVAHPTMLLPVTRSRQPWRSGQRRVSMFPSYLFVAFDLEDPSWRRIATQPGVQRIFGSDPQSPTPITPWSVRTPTGPQTYTVEDLLSRPEEALAALSARALITPGVTAKPLSGPWDAQEGPCTSTRTVRVADPVTGVLTAEDRVTLLLSLFGRPMPVEFRHDDVEIVA